MQLLFPGFLFGLAASVIPVIIHLLQLRRPQRIRFTNTEFIRQLELTVARQRRIKQWLVLLTRVLALVFLVLAFCQPFIPARKYNVAGATNQVQVLVDTSPSMQAITGAGESLLRTAVSEAQDLGRAYGTQQQFGLLQPRRNSLMGAAYQAQLQELIPNGRAIGLQKGLASDAVASQTGAGTLYVFSDFQRNQVSANLFRTLAPRQEVVLVPIVGRRVGNVFVDSVWVDDAFVRVRTNVGLHVRLRNGGQVATTDCPVKVFLGRQQVASFRVSVAAGQVNTAVVQVQVADKTLAQGRVVTEDAPVVFDNTYYFTLQPADRIRVVELGAEPIAQRLYSNEPVFNYSFNSAATINYGLLRAANLVLVREVPQLTVGLQQALQEVVKRGGTVVIVPSADKKSQASYQALFRGMGVGNPQWEAVGAAPELREVAMPSGRESFFRDVFGTQQRQVTMPRAAPVLRWARTGEDILKFRDGESYLAGFRTGAGRVYVFAAPFEARYSDFTSHALFVPVMYRLAMLSYRNDQLPAYRLTQPAIMLSVPEGGRTADEAGYRLVKDSLTLIPGQRLQGAELRLEVPAGLAEPGFYQLRQQDRVVTTLAFNQDKRESELAAYSAADLRQLVGTNHPNVRVLEGGVGNAVARDRAAQTGQPLWRYCVGAALICLLAEVLLLRRRRAPENVAVAG